MEEFLLGWVNKNHFTKRMIACVLAVIMMGFTLSWLVMIEWGADPFSAMNLGISKTIGLSLGTWQAFLNFILFLLVIIFDNKQIGFGTLFNMFLVGYSCDFFTWVWSFVLPEGLPETLLIRGILMVIMLSLFVIVASIYMTVDLGMSPYDALPQIIYEHQSKFSFKMIRMAWDISAVIIGLVFGATLGIVTFVMAFALGPVIAFIRPYVDSFFKD